MVTLTKITFEWVGKHETINFNDNRQSVGGLEATPLRLLSSSALPPTPSRTATTRTTPCFTTPEI